jgi:RHS repeat-associated protein
MNRFWTMTMAALAATSLVVPAALADQAVTALAPFDTILDGRNELVGVAVTTDGVCYVSDRGAGLVYRVDASGALSVAASNLDRPAGLTLDGEERLLIVEERAGRIRRLHGGRLTVVAAGLNRPRSIAPAGDGAFYLSVDRRLTSERDHDDEDGEIVRLAADGVVSVVATGISHLEGLARVNGHLLAASRGLAHGRTGGGALLRYPVLVDGSLGTAVTWVATGLKKPMGLAADALAAVYVTSKQLTLGNDHAHGAVGKVHADAHVTDFAAHLSDPRGMAFGPDGALYVADGKSGRLLRFRAPPVPTLGPLASATSRPTAIVSGTTEADARVDVFVNVATSAAVVAPEATGAFTVSVPLTENADNRLEVFATAHAGNGLTSSPAVVSIVHDTVAPEVMFQVPLAGAYVRQIVTVQARATDGEGAIVLMTLRAAAQPLATVVAPPPPAPSVTATASWDSTTSADGGQTLVADVVDRAGNTHSVTRAVIVDNTPPDTQITAGDTDGASATFSFMGHDNLTPAGSLAFAWRLDGGAYTAFASATSATLTRLPEGTHTFEVRARDLAGNEDPAPATRTFTVLLGPAITAVTPSSGSVGVFVTITGRNFEPGATVSFNGVPAVVRTTTPTTITTTVPVGATTGPLGVTASHGTATRPFTVTLTADFTIAAAPATVRAIAGDEAGVTISVEGGGTLTSLATLGLSPTVTGITPRFGSGFVAPGATTSLTLSVAGTAAPGLYTFTVSGEAQVDGRTLVRTASVVLEVLAADTLAVTGRVMMAESIPRPIPGVTVALGTGFNVTDAAGNFVVLSPATGPNMLLLDGRTAGTPQAQFPVVEVQVDVHPSGPTRLPFIVYLPILDNANPIDLPLDAAGFVTQEVRGTTPRIPGLVVTIPAGTRIVGPDGNPVSQLVITPVPVDRTPMPFPDGVVPSLLFAINPGGSAPSRPLPITFPNLTNAPPGASADLWYFDLVAGGWTVWGTGTVTADGTQIASDPGYGLPRLAWHFAFTISTSEQVRDRHAKGGDPVDLVTGRFTVAKTDLVLPARIRVTIQRLYRSENSGKGLFGIGWNLGIYDSTIARVGQGPSLTLILANQSSYLLTPLGAEWRNMGEPFLRGAVVTALPGDFNFQIRYKDGTVHRYERIQGFLAAALVSITDRNGNTLTINRASGLFVRRITQIVEPAGRVLSFGYDAAERITSITDPLNRVARYTYGTGGRLETVTDAAGGVTRYTYDAGHRILTVTDARGITYLSNEYDVAGRVVRQTQADGGVWRFDYFVPAFSGAVAPPAPGSTLPGFQPPGLLFTPPPVSPRFSFNASTAPPPASTTVTDPRGHATTYRFNAEGFTLSETDAFGQTTTYSYDPVTNDLQSVHDALGRVTRYTYDADGNVLTIVDPAGGLRTFTYGTPFGRMTSKTDELGPVTHFEYDAAGNLTAAIDPLGHRTTLAYDGFGDTVAITDALNHTVSFSYDPHGHRVTITDPRTQTTTRRYDIAGRMTERRDPNGRRTVFAYDARDRMTAITDATSGSTRMTYDRNGNLLTVTDAVGNTTSHTYDPLNRLATRTDPSGHTDTYVWDEQGNLTQQTNRNSQISRYTYDALNRVVRAVYADGSTVLYGYDAVGRLADVVDSLGGFILRSYDSMDRVLTESVPVGTIGYKYDAGGRRLEMQATGQSTIHYEYDENFRLVTLAEAGRLVTVEHDRAGRRTLLTLPNGVSTEYQYDATARVTALIYRNARGLVGDVVYEYDPAGNRVAVRGSLARTVPPSPVADAAYSPGNRQDAVAGRAMTYDNNGNLITLADDSGTTRFTWDARNRLIAINGPHNATTFQYDAFGRRSSKTNNGTTIKYLYDAGDVVAEVSPTTAMPYLRAPWPDEPFVRGEDEFYVIAAPGSVLALTDGSGAVTNQYDYTAFGETTPSGSSSNPFQFGGRENDGTGLYYYRARYYSPALQRFISEDPIGFGGGDANLYGYAYNNPVALIDRGGFDATNWRPAPNRNLLVDGPRNGNWGGARWSGGLTPPYYGPPAPPTDSGDECYMNHDNCWGDCDTCPSNRRLCMKDCDRAIVGCLQTLSTDPTQWSQPPRPGMEKDSGLFRDWALRFFGNAPYGSFGTGWVMPWQQ